MERTYREEGYARNQTDQKMVEYVRELLLNDEDVQEYVTTRAIEDLTARGFDLSVMQTRMAEELVCMSQIRLMAGLLGAVADPWLS